MHAEVPIQLQNKADVQQRQYCSPSLPTLVELDQQQLDAIVRTVPGGAGNVQDIYPLSPLQEGMLFHHLINQNSDTYLLSTLFELDSRKDVRRFVDALQKVIERHDILRTAVLWEDLPQAVQVVYRWATLAVEELQLDADGEPLEQLMARMKPRGQQLDLSKAPVMRLQLASAGGGRWYALLQVHHLICDYQSIRVVIEEAAACLDGRAAELARPMPYRAFMERVLANSHNPQAEAFFCDKLRDFVEPTAPFGLLEVHGDGTRIEEAHQAIDADLARQIRAEAKGLGVSAARLFHAAWGLFVARTSGQADVVFGTVLGVTRQRKGQAERMLGMSINTLPLRLRLGVSARELVEQTHQELAALLNHANAPLSLARRCSGIAGTAPLFTAILNYRRAAVAADEDSGTSRGMRELAYRGAWTNYPVALQVDDLGEGFTLTAQTDQRINPSRIVGYLVAALESLTTALRVVPQTPVLALSILPDSERRQVLESFNATRSAYPQGELLHQLFERQMERCPHAIAVTYEDRFLTYAELNGKANHLASLLKAHGVRPDERVGLAVGRGMEMVVGLLGILKAGGAYVPLDSSYPVERLRYMLEDSKPVALVTQEHLKAALPIGGVPVVTLDGIELVGSSDCNPDPAQLGLSPAHLAAVIYTSGSTGLPKGVMVEHAGLCNLAHMQKSSFDVLSDSHVLQFASLSFDACTWECVMALCNGARLCMASREDLAPGEPLLAFLRTRNITHATLPPVVLAALPLEDLPQLTTMIVAGESCPLALAKKWSLGRRFINAYGPTEATVCATLYRYESRESESLPIGRPIENAQIYILDPLGDPVPIGVSGEIHIAGVGVTRGYLGQPQLTATRYLPNRFSAEGCGYLYKTGDMGRWRDDGLIEFLGRNDHQVKVRGFRIELEEIEARLAEHDDVREVAVIAREDTPGDKRLVAYVACRWPASGAEEFRSFLRRTLPEYMIPSAFVAMERLPLTPNGKVSRRELPAPDVSAYSDRIYEEPRGDTESAIAKIWEDLLCVERIGRNDNFFEMGGHSLLVMKAIARMRTALAVQVPMRLLFESPTLMQLSSQLELLRRNRLFERISDGGESVRGLLERVAAMPESQVHQLVKQLSEGKR